ncbi:ferredoxin--NADP reductase [Xanthovirga aplysinae]|uniref:ferredoxin--NADP reductase n=1 Tax=Xanthovirga aplysinae TaxID=2529853 RepID=UPI0012BD4242|nr:ferredoxin--NADP reductase [Xanthovirga aplysinae]MTI29413.1 ferredoxin--NADP reductase [Xanthovirga aplysinae]
MLGFFKRKKKEKVPEHEPGHGKSSYYNLQVREVVKETPDTITIYFDLPDGGISYIPGQFFTLIMDLGGNEIRRAYSLCTCPETDPYPGVTVKRMEGGLMSNHLNDHLKAGDSIKVMEPIGNFTVTVDKELKRHLVLFGGGSGITPLMSIAKSVLHGEKDSQVSLVYGNRDIESIIFKEEIESLEKKYPDNFQVRHVLEKGPENWSGAQGYLTKELIEGYLKEFPDFGAKSTSYYMCGPEGLMNVVTESLEVLGIDHHSVFKESFTTSAVRNEPSAEDGTDVSREVTVIFDDEEFKFVVEPGKTILETALDLDIDLPFSCQSGLCTACRGKCLSGSVKMDETEGLSEEELEEGYVLTCVGHPASDDVKIEIG